LPLISTSAFGFPDEIDLRPGVKERVILEESMSSLVNGEVTSQPARKVSREMNWRPSQIRRLFPNLNIVLVDFQRGAILRLRSGTDHHI
jgi:hypothetical protein